MPFTYFLAHASVDKPLVRQLHAALGRAGVRCFLDEVDIVPGDEWDRAISLALRTSAATLVLVSPRYDAAYYLRDEVHAAIARGRAAGSEHRVIPIYVDGPPDPMPYGLGLKQGLDLNALGLDEVVARLVEISETLGASLPDARAAPASSTPESDRARLYQALCAIHGVGGLFQEIVLLDLPEAAAYISSGTASPALRASDLVQWASMQGRDTLDRLYRAVQRRAPGLL